VLELDWAAACTSPKMGALLRRQRFGCVIGADVVYSPEMYLVYCPHMCSLPLFLSRPLFLFLSLARALALALSSSRSRSLPLALALSPARSHPRSLSPRARALSGTGGYLKGQLELVSKAATATARARASQ
jgi:hypothetical protein